GRTAVIAGEISTREPVSLDLPAIVRKVYEDAGYTEESLGFAFDDIIVQNLLHEQSAEIARAVAHADGRLGAGDQGVVFGYATNETPKLMPLPVMLARRLMGRHHRVMTSGEAAGLFPDAKAQVTMTYAEGEPKEVTAIVLSTQHRADLSLDEVRTLVETLIIDPVIPENMRHPECEIMINPGGRFTTGGPMADTGMTGRKIVVDAYGPFCQVGGGAFSGKDATKIDRSAAYLARYIAKNVVNARLARRCVVQLGYAIGREEPVSLSVSALGTGEITDDELTQLVREHFPLTPAEIIKTLELRKPIFAGTARQGHFGAVKTFPWEKTPVNLEFARPQPQLRPFVSLTMTDQPAEPPMPELNLRDNPFEALCQFPVKWNWCTRVGCSTCGNGLILDKLKLLGQGVSPKTEPEEFLSSRIRYWNVPMTPAQEATLAGIIADASFQWLVKNEEEWFFNFLWFILFRLLPEYDRRTRYLTITLATKFLPLVGFETHMGKYLREILRSSTKRITMRELGYIRSAL
ncbi:MAG: methionine adenosyltransferase, partial [Candidatus Zixiibacteriota bacterium]